MPDTIKLQEDRSGGVQVELPEEKETAKPEELTITSEPAPSREEEVEERSAKKVQDEDDGGKSLEQELQEAGSDDEREKIRERRRAERASKRQRRREHTEALEQTVAAQAQQLQQLQQHVAQLTRRSTGTELAQLDEEINRTANTISEFKNVIADATTQQQGDIVAEATESMTKAIARGDQLRAVRANFLENAKRANGQRPETNAPATTQPDRQTMRKVHQLGSSWMSQNSWYDPQGQDMDSRLTRAIDDAIISEGYDPSSPDYWEELSDRVAKHLPHRGAKDFTRGQEKSYNGGTTTQKSERRSPVAGSGRESASPGSGNSRSYKLSPERVTALKEAGVWDDPAKLRDAVRRYQEYDNAQRSAT